MCRKNRPKSRQESPTCRLRYCGLAPRRQDREAPRRMLQSHASAERRPSVLERQPPPCRPLPLGKKLRVPLRPASRMALVRLHGSLSPETKTMHRSIYDTFPSRSKPWPAEPGTIPLLPFTTFTSPPGRNPSARAGHSPKDEFRRKKDESNPTSGHRHVRGIPSYAYPPPRRHRHDHHV